MKYRAETIEKYKANLKREMRNALSNAENIHLHVSLGNKKIGKTINFNLPAIASCGGMCRKCGCAWYCYAIKDAIRFPRVLKNRVENMALLLKNEKRYWQEVRNAINRHPSFDFIRFHVSGEIMNEKYLSEMVAVARDYPTKTFWTYTKQYAIVNDDCANNGGRSSIPSNLVIMFSEWDGYPMDNRYGFPIFYFEPDGKEPPKNIFRCCGNCNICKAKKCGCVGGCSAYAMEH